MRAVACALVALGVIGCDSGAGRPEGRVSPTKLRVRAEIDKPGLHVTVTECNASARPEHEKNEPKAAWEGVKSSRWRDDGVLQVEAAAVENCGARFTDAGYVLAGDALSLTYAAGLVNNVPAACNCLFRMNYEISGLSRRAYEYRFSGSGMEPD